MEQWRANSWWMTINEKKFIQTALLFDLRADGRHPFDYRRLTIKFGREDGSSEVQLGQTHVMCFVTSQLVQPYRDRPNEGALSIYTEFSPMADPSFEAGRPTESAVELGRIIDRGLRESRAIDMESLCVVAGKSVWAIRVDIHILDNGGNLVDAANIAALAALSTFQRPECTFGGEDGQDVIMHPPEVREPLPLIIHHLPVTISFGYFGNETTVVLDPSHKEEAVMEGRLTATLNASGDVCSIQKAGEVGVVHSVLMQCLRIASVKAADITSKIKNSVESYNTERALRKIKRHSCPAASDSCEPHTDSKGLDDMPVQRMERSHERAMCQSSSTPGEIQSSDGGDGHVMGFTGGPSSWDSHLKGIDSDAWEATPASKGYSVPRKEVEEEVRHEQHTALVPEELNENGAKILGQKPLKGAVKSKHKRRKK